MRKTLLWILPIVLANCSGNTETTGAGGASAGIAGMAGSTGAGGTGGATGTAGAGGTGIAGNAGAGGNPGTGGATGTAGAGGTGIAGNAGAGGTGGATGTAGASGGAACQPRPGCASTVSCFDGCNTCSCLNGQWACTGRACIDAGPAPGDAAPTDGQAGCNYTDPSKTYYGKSAAQCAVVKFACPDTSTHFADTCGCGCVSAPTDCNVIACLRAITCVTQCGGTAVSVGCCPCIPPAFDDYLCPRDASR